jgi:methylated-DNA-[protein]-cysteine S-methyltransferase
VPANGSITCYTHVDTPIGRLLLGGDGTALRMVSFPSGQGARSPEPGWRHRPELFAEALQQLQAYFAGSLREFSLPLAPAGTPFQLRVWTALRQVPYGTTVSYAEIARRIGAWTAVRAVGLANGGNPLPIVIPCHRVIGSNGRLTGYGGGLDVKRFLIDLERTQAGGSAGTFDASGQGRLHIGR